jgi:hypothetical protein
MLIDTHLHENKYSYDSNLDLMEAISTAKSAGLDGICVTNHDNDHIKKDIGLSSIINEILVITGSEVLTNEGDILVYGLPEIPMRMMNADELLLLVRRHGGAAIAAHPFRKNNRGLGNNIRRLTGLLSGVEAFNGSTPPHLNLEALALSLELSLPSFGASDAHLLERVGIYATRFLNRIRDHHDFIEAIKYGNLFPSMRTQSGYRDLNYGFESSVLDRRIG